MRRIQKHKAAKNILEQAFDHPSHVLLIHYSCESFYNIENGRTPRITAIAIRYLRSAQTKTFSIHKVAETLHVAFGEINNQYDMLEKEMLQEYFQFLREHKEYTWIHWNMRDINYGFEAIEHRFQVLGGEPVLLSDDKKLDMARMLIEKYGIHYIDHPRLVKLIELNNISNKNLLIGAEEATAFENKEYVRLHQSTLKKVDVMDTILKLSVEGRLKTNASFIQIYGLTPQGIFELVKDHWLWGLIVGLLGILLGTLLS